MNSSWYWTVAVLAAVALLGLSVPGTAGTGRGGPFRAREAKADDLRWKDIGDHAYSSDFVKHFSYSKSASLLALDFGPGAPPGGKLLAKGLKPNFAYQLKLVGRVGVKGPTAEDNALDPQAWASYELGRAGRWWCEQCNWNTWDGDISYHVEMGHKVVGYVLFDWLVTDSQGQAQVPLRVNSSYHVLWKVSQRRPNYYDSNPRPYQLQRAQYGYGRNTAKQTAEVELYAEWETGRVLPGQLALTPGPYEVVLNLTEESFHASTYGSNGKGGGSWAQVLEAPVDFEVKGETGSAGYNGLLASPWSALRHWLGKSWEKAKTATVREFKP
jgi:hypothetical protein